jgi:hypothetical protein
MLRWYQRSELVGGWQFGEPPAGFVAPDPATLPDWQKIEKQRAEARQKQERARLLRALGLPEDTDFGALVEAAKARNKR